VQVRRGGQHRRHVAALRLQIQGKEANMTSPRSQSGPHRSRLVLCLLAGALACVFAAINASGASALTTATNCALPGSTFQGGDGNQTTPTLAEESFCNGSLLPTTRDWQGLTNVINSPDPQANDTEFEGGDKESAPGSWGIQGAGGPVNPGKTNIMSGWSQADPQAAATFLYLFF